MPHNATKSIIILLLMLFPISGESISQSPSAINDLRDLVNRSVQRAHALRANEAAVQEKKTELKLNMTGYLPRVETHGSVSYYRFLLPNKQKLLGDSRSSFYTDFSLVQPIYDWGKISVQNDIVHHQLLYQEEFGRQLINTLIQNVSNAFCQLLAARSEVQGHEVALARLREHLRIARHRHAIGAVSETDVLRVQLEIESRERDLLAAGVRVRQAEIELVHLCFLDTAADIGPDYSLTGMSLPPVSVLLDTKDAIMSDVETEHPLLRMAKSRVMMEEQTRSLTELGNRPELRLFGIASWEDGSIPFGSNFNYHIGIEVNYTIPYLGGSGYQYRIEQSNYRIAQISAESRQLLQDVRTDIDQSLVMLAGIIAERSKTDSILALAQKTVDIATLMYNTGEGTIIDILDAQTVVTQTAILRDALTIGYLREYARLMFRAGNEHWLYNLESQ